MVHEIARVFPAQQMSERTLVPIFFFWALLTIITPTLILLSEKSKADLDLNGKHLNGIANYPQSHSPRMIYVNKFACELSGLLL